MRRKAVFIRFAIGINFIRNINDDGFLFADALPSVVDPMGHLNQQWVMDPDEELIDLSFGWRVLPWIVKHQLDHSLDGNDVIRLDFVKMPGLHDPRIGRGDIDLSKL
jgi:hypothetical protein